jgi:MFS family permease
LDVELQSSWKRSVDAVVDSHKRAWLADIAIGGVIGGVIGAIVAVNFVIYVGIEGGYEATIPEVFRQNVVAGVITVAVLVGGPLLGVVVARRLRRRRAGSRNQ